ncbi:transporter substrate-binding domain-containing protein [Desulfobacterales bacterium HSG17]|nr:transporter substrate-binding domain-containing protein [Desulfobacterales bacterium HSG17]
MHRLIGIFLFLGCLFFSPINTFAEQPVVLHVGNWSPYIDPTLKGGGLLSEIVSAAFASIGRNIQLEYFPWKRVEAQIDNHNGISFGYIKNEERKLKWLYSDEITKGGSVFAARKDAGISWKALNDVKPYRIGITHGYSYGDEFDRYKPELKVQIAYTDEENFEKLLERKIELFCIDYTVGAMLLRKRFSPEVRAEIELIMEPPIVNYSMFMVCAKSSPVCKEIVVEFNQGLQIIYDNGQKEAIIKRYMVFD